MYLYIPGTAEVGLSRITRVIKSIGHLVHTLRSWHFQLIRLLLLYLVYNQVVIIILLLFRQVGLINAQGSKETNLNYN